MIARAVGVALACFVASASAETVAADRGILGAQVAKGQRCVDVALEDGRFRFHALWLRDACRDELSVVRSVGERRLTATPVTHAAPAELRASHVDISEDGQTLQVQWEPSFPEDEVRASRFDLDFLRRYAPVVAKKLSADSRSEPGAQLGWLQPYTGYPSARAARGDEIRLWSNRELREGTLALPRMTHDDAMADPLAMMLLFARFGVVVIDGAPAATDASKLQDFAYHTMGGLQKDPARSDPNWKITKKAGATSISYDHDKRLINHTDQSVPPHGLPGVALMMHYLDGSGCNTIVDGFAAAQRLREENPRAFRLLATYGYDAERDFIASRVDSSQEHTKSLLVARKHPIFELDDDGNLRRIVYNEVFRTPSTLPYDVFPDFFAALNRWVQLLHDPEFETEVPMEGGRMLLMNNWRVLHGRAGGRATSSRTVVGGTVLRENFFSKATHLLGIRGDELHAAFH